MLTLSKKNNNEIMATPGAPPRGLSTGGIDFSSKEATMKSAGLGGGDDRRSLLTINDLTYVLEPDLSCAVNVTHKKAFFQANNYSNGQTAVCIMNSGADYIDARRSYLSFAIKPRGAVFPDTTAGFFGVHGSALNCIESIVISSRSGNELIRCHDVPLLANMLLPLTFTKGWFETVGSGMGFGSGVWSNDKQRSRGNPDHGQRFVIPLYCLSSLFQYSRLFPCGLFSGLRIEIKWNSGENAFMAMTDRVPIGELGELDIMPTPAVITSYEIIQPYFNLCCVQLTDSIQRALNEQSTTNGLEIVYTDYEKTSYGTGGMFDTCHVEVRKACSRALKAFARVRSFTDIEVEQDHYRAEVHCPVTQYQWQLGSLYFPHQPVLAKAGQNPIAYGNTKGAADNQDLLFESYFMLLDAMDKVQGTKCAPYLTLRGCDVISNNTSNSLFRYIKYGIGDPVHADHEIDSVKDGKDYDELEAHIPYYPTVRNGLIGSFCVDQHTFGVSLERSTMFNLAGVPINNSRVLVFHANMINATRELKKDQQPAKGDARREVDVWLKYVKLARVWLNNLEVEQ